MSILRFKDDGPIKVSVADFNTYRDMQIENFEELFDLWSNPHISNGVRRLSLRDMLRQNSLSGRLQQNPPGVEDVCHIVNYVFNNCYDSIIFCSDQDGKGLRQYLIDNPRMRQEIISETIYNFEHGILPKTTPTIMASFIEILMGFSQGADFDRLWSYHPLNRSRSSRLQSIAQRLKLSYQSNSLPTRFCDRLWREIKQDVSALIRAYERPLSLQPRSDSFGKRIVEDFVAGLKDIHLLSKMSSNPRSRQIVNEGCQILQENLPLAARPFIRDFEQLPID